MALPSALGTQTVICTCKQVAVCLHESTMCRCEGLFAQARKLSTHWSQERLFLYLGHTENPAARSPACTAAHEKASWAHSLLPQAWRRCGMSNNLHTALPPPGSPPSSLPGGRVPSLAQGWLALLPQPRPSLRELERPGEFTEGP